MKQRQLTEMAARLLENTVEVSFNFFLAKCSIVLCSIHCAVYWSYVELFLSLLLFSVPFTVIAVELITGRRTKCDDLCVREICLEVSSIPSNNTVSSDDIGEKVAQFLFL